MALQVVTVTHLATLDGRHLTHTAFLLQSSNGLQTIYDWPRSPPGEFSPEYLCLWPDALHKSLVLPQNGQSSRTLLFQICVQTWRNPSVLDLWKWFTSPADQHLYQWLGQGWRVWSLVHG